MKVLVIGGAGYIGSVTTAELLSSGHEAIVLDNLSRGHRRSVPQGATFFQADFGDRQKLEELFANQSSGLTRTSGPIDAVMHFGALSLVSESVNDPSKYFDNNLSKGLVLLDCLREHDIKNFVFSSTAAVYGEPAVTPIAEDCLLAPTNPYGESKLAFEKILKWYSQAYGLRYTSLRYFNAAGATADLGEDHLGETHLIPLVLQVALGQADRISVYGDDYDTADGTCIRDYIHVRDLALAHVAALEAMIDTGSSQIFNLGNGVGFSVKQIIECARKITGHAIPYVISSRRPGDPSILIASNEKIKRTIGWQPRFSDVNQVIGDAWNWHQKYPSGYQDMNLQAPSSQDTQSANITAGFNHLV